MKGRKGFVPGQSGNPAGRPKGAANKLTKSVRELLSACIHVEMDRLPETLKQLEPRDRVDAIVKLMPYVMPKMPEQQQLEDSEEEKRQSFVELIKQQFPAIEGTIVYRRVEDGQFSTVEYNTETGIKKIQD